MKKVNYLNNRDLLSEIHKSKTSFCSFLDDEYSEYHLIVKDVDAINIRTVAQAKRYKAKKLTQQDYERRKKLDPKTKLSECEIDYRKIDKDDVVFRVMTFDHVPDEPGRKKNPKTIADGKTKVNFPPFSIFLGWELILHHSLNNQHQILVLHQLCCLIREHLSGLIGTVERRRKCT